MFLIECRHPTVAVVPFRHQSFFIVALSVAAATATTSLLPKTRVVMSPSILLDLCRCTIYAVTIVISLTLAVAVIVFNIGPALNMILQPSPAPSLLSNSRVVV
jgi:hypothetical protein